MSLLIFISFIWWQFIAAFAVSAGLHRYFTHNAFKAPAWYEILVLFLAPFSGSGSVLSWAGVHRLHHQYSDSPKDPHSPRFVGYIKVLTSTFDVPHIPPKQVADLLRNKHVVWFHRNHLKIRIVSFILGIVVLPFSYFLIFLVAPYIYGYLGFGLLNWLCHRSGAAQNSFIANILTGGEGWHFNHHSSPGSVNIGKNWWQLDLGAIFIKLVRTKN